VLYDEDLASPEQNREHRARIKAQWKCDRKGCNKDLRDGAIHSTGYQEPPFYCSEECWGDAKRIRKEFWIMLTVVAVWTISFIALMYVVIKSWMGW